MIFDLFYPPGFGRSLLPPQQMWWYPVTVTRPVSPVIGIPISDEDVERIAARVVELMEKQEQ